ncbi:hypothetical protein SAICODRAFT_28840 [Saitoella complicata NRRL Y-17804]|uniref:WSC domain-containing protein n=1 Tax=Saitoella complicata (strain BCRC 22490 / CBS 7301 / JCM 7358 / NBRC 10748 / NRRL Y-17804) TaxID=698492 RepID=A0A0E9NAC2_SAICN|nr:uncharacterized protein SAICODRAFT_28840 [Saitoella complicata NRRL Y-17804]ODQ55838.1 hypothetical protein SAICODRAFT_28840 [Saitoella complicata NRRL Y-17804]GAO46748.1 hypothetical protein G7K_0970-t1 [Saitoella complicata NRRL Y-17804]
MRLDVGFIPVATLLCSTVDAFWRLPCGAPVVVERMDPIVNPGLVSSHVHTIMGSDAINFTNTFNSLRAADCTTCQVTEDLSNYWTPNLWFQHPNGSFTSVPQIGGMLVYYLQRYNSQTDTELVAFPDGFRMVAGNPMLRSYYPSLEQRAISWMCINYAAQSLEKPYFPLTYCPHGLRAQVFFPSCWDGVNLDSANHKSHVAYPSNMNSGTCPPTHPIRLISLFYEVMFDVAQFSSLWTPDGVSQPFVLANGDPTGYGLHGDFMNGWNRDVLQRAIDNCTDMSGDINVCEVFDGMLQTTQEMSSCVAYPQVIEDVSGTLDELPGCNPIQSGGYPSAMATMPVCTLKPETLSKDEAEYEEFLLSPHPVNHTGWHYLGCYNDSSSRTLPKQTWLPATTKPSESCMDACAAAGYTLAGLEYYGQCFCGNSLANGGIPRPDQECWMPCSGNSTQTCGGDWRLTVYQVGAGKKFTWMPEVKTTRTVSYSVIPSPPVLTTATSTVKTTGSSLKVSSTAAKGSSMVGTATGSAGAKAVSTASTITSSSTSLASSASAVSSSASCTINCGSNSCCPSTSNGQQCYNPSVYTCIFETSSTGKVTLCSFGMDACNGGCFDPSKYRCEGGTLKQGAASTSASSSLAVSSSKVSSVKVSSSVKSLSSVKTSVETSAKASATKTTSKKSSSTAKTSAKTTSSTKASTKVSATSSVKSTVNLSGLSAAAVAASTKISSVKSISITASSSKPKISAVKASSTKATLTAVSTAKISAMTSSIKASSTVKATAKTSSVMSTSAKATSVVSPSALLLAVQQTTGSSSSRKSASSVKSASSTKKASLTDVTSTQTHTTTTWTTDTTVWVDPPTSSKRSTSTKVSSVKSSSSSKKVSSTTKATSSVETTVTAKSSVKSSSTWKVSSSAATSTASTKVSSSVKSVSTSKISSSMLEATLSAAKTSSSAVKSASSTSASVSMKATSSSKTSSANTKAASSVAKAVSLSVKPSTTTIKPSTMTSKSTIASTSSMKSTVASSSTSSATPATSSASATFISQMLTMHNSYRAAHSAQPLAWNKNLEKYAQNIADTCAFGDSSGSYGENMGLGTNSNSGYYLQKWYNEQNFYDYDTPTGYSAKTEHFTRVVWNATTQIGCAFATNCGSVGPYYYPYLLVCEYWRAGNVNNTGSDKAANPWKWYKTNVLPPA